ncbi:MAG: hypothetical protein KKB20_09200 [Proteobacteria bacterium]|nr:hypothetical protein [Pseudomonadota bacterium]
MATKRELIGSELMREIISIRVDTLWKMLALRKWGHLPKIDDEGATGEFDNKGAMFVPGGFIFQDSDKKPIPPDRAGWTSAEMFREKVRECMRYDNASLIYPDGLGFGINLDNGFFAEMASRILAVKHAAMQRKTTLTVEPPADYGSWHVTRSFCPTYINPPYGSRTKLSACLAACLIEPRIYFVQCRTALGLRGDEERDFWEKIRNGCSPITSQDDKVLAYPYVIVCHTTRHRKEVLGGITRILGYGRFGEFAIFTLEEATNDLLHEIEGGKTEFAPADLFAEYEDIQVVGVLRTFPKTTPGKRLMKQVTARLVQPVKDLELDLERITGEARARYKID